MKDPSLARLPEDVQALLDRGALIEAAPEASRQRVLERVEAAIARGGSSGSGGGGAAVPYPAGDDAKPAPRASWKRAAPLGASFILGAIVAVALLRREAVPAPPPRAWLEPAPPVASALDLPAVSPPLVPSSEASASPPQPHESPRRPAAPAGDTFSAEKKLLDQARSALGRDDPAAALAATSLHEKEFPHGALVQEREAVAIRALVALGQTSQARARAARFRTQFPRSVLLPSVDAISDSTQAP
jgi:hypothetical protein